MIDRMLKVLPPRLADFVWALPGVAERTPVLALAHDGFELHAALMARRGAQLVVLGGGHSRAVAFAAAVREVVAQVTEQADERPRRAVLATACAIAALLELPVEDDTPKPAREMLGLVRWELEPLMAEHIALWTLGALLEGRGCIDAGARAQIARQVSLRQSEATGVRNGQPTARFGEVAIELGFARREHVEECLALQSQLQSMDDQVVCAWAPRGKTTEGGRSLWLAAGLGLAAQSRWADACQRQGLRLEGITPLAGASLAVCPPEAVVMEAHANQLLVARLREGRPVRLMLRPRGEQAPQAALASMLTELLEPDDKLIYLQAPAAWASGLAADLGQRVAHPVSPLWEALEGDARPVNAQPLTGIPGGTALLAAAREVLLAGVAMLPRLPGSEPPPPPLKRPQTWVVVGAAALALLAGGYELSAWARMLWLRDKVSALTNTKSAKERDSAQVNEARRKAAELLTQAEKLKQQTAAAQAQLRFYRDELGGRGAFIATLLDQTPAVIGPEVVLDSLSEDKWFELSVNGWAVSQSAAYRFAKDAGQALSRWGFEVRDIHVKTQSGRSGLLGYALQFRLVRVQPAENATNKEKRR